MAYEDYTTYTEVDTVGVLTVASNTLTITDLERNHDVYLYKDKGVGHFGDYTFDMDFNITSASNGGGFNFGGVSNTLGNRANWTTGQEGYVARYLSTFVIISMRDLGNSNVDTYMASVNTCYYIELKRAGTTGTLKIYSDASHTTLLDTLTITTQNTTFRYVYGMTSNDTGDAGYNTNGYIYNLDLHDSSTPLTPSDTVSISDSVSISSIMYYSVHDYVTISDSAVVGSILNEYIHDYVSISDNNTKSLNPLILESSCAKVYLLIDWNGQDKSISKIIELFNFWSGNFETTDSGIGGKPLHLKGTFSNNYKIVDDVETCVNNINAMMNSGAEITINTQGACINGMYVIKNFSYSTIRGLQNSFIWSLELEFVRKI